MKKDWYARSICTNATTRITCVLNTTSPIASATPFTDSPCWKNPSKYPPAHLSGQKKATPSPYVGPHWVDLFYNYYRSKPVSLTAVGQKKRLIRDGIDAYDAVQVRVDFDNGMSIYFHNNWITPDDFEGPVNQGHEIVGTDGKVESDQQYRGFRFWYADGGSQSSNNHFTRNVKRPRRLRSLCGIRRR